MAVDVGKMGKRMGIQKATTTRREGTSPPRQVDCYVMLARIFEKCGFHFQQANIMERENQWQSPPVPIVGKSVFASGSLFFEAEFS